MKLKASLSKLSMSDADRKLQDVLDLLHQGARKKMGQMNERSVGSNTTGTKSTYSNTTSGTSSTKGNKSRRGPRKKKKSTSKEKGSKIKGEKDVTPLEIELMMQVEENNRLLNEKKLLMDAISHGEKTFKSREMNKIFSGDNKPFMSDEIFRFQDRKFNASYVPKLECNPTDLIGYERWEKMRESWGTWTLLVTKIQQYLGLLERRCTSGDSTCVGMCCSQN